MEKIKKRYTAAELRRNIWRSLDVLRVITIPALVGTIEGLGYDSAKKALRSLEIHGYVEKAGKRGGGHQQYVRSRKVALLPAVCEECGAPFSAKTCDPLFREKEKEREREREEAQRAAAWHKVPAELKERLEKGLNDYEEEPEVAHDAA